MTGHLWVADPGRPPAPHQHVVIPLDDGRELRFADTRRFGLLRVVAESLLPRHPLLHGLGPEPFDPALSAADLLLRSRGRRRPIKSLLLDTRTIAGIGNIYACESLFRAEIHPAAAVGRIRAGRWERLLEELRAVLNGRSMPAGRRCAIS
jgi:formamidopyrimidine-DNA glycosylase